MKNRILLSAFMLTTSVLFAQQNQVDLDSTKTQTLEEVLVKSVRVKPNAPIAHSNVAKAQLESRNLGHGYLGQKNARNYHLTLILVAMVFMLLYVMLSSHNISIWVIMIGFIPLLIHLTIFYSVVNPKDYDPQLKVLALSTFLLALIFGASHIFI